MESSQNTNEEPRISLTLATGKERWETYGTHDWDRELQLSGRLWILVPAHNPRSLEDMGPFVALRREVAEWCWENIGPYLIVDHEPTENVGLDGDDSWEIVFKNAKDAIAFKLHWM